MVTAHHHPRSSSRRSKRSPRFKKKSSSATATRSRLKQITVAIKKIILICLGVAASLVLILGVLWVLGPQLFSLDQPANVMFVSSKIDDSNSEIYYAEFLPDSQEILLFSLVDTQVSVLGNYGSYRLSAVYPLLYLDNQPNQVVRASYSWAMQRIIDHLVTPSQNPSLSTRREILLLLRKELFSRGLHLQELKSLAQLYFFTRAVPTSQIQLATQPRQLDQLSLPNDTVYQDCEIAVVNTTGKSGLATQVTTILESSGAKVVRVADQSGLYESSAIDYDPQHESCSLLAPRIKHIFPQEILVENSSVVRQEQRADLVIFLGKDLAEP